MSDPTSNRPNMAPPIDEWRVSPGESAEPEAAEADAANDWSHADARLRCARMNAELASWREELNERLGRLERRLSKAAGARE
jgi:hypothetical protein